MPAKLRLLAHAGASASHASDARYKAQAAAYLALKDVRRSRIDLVPMQQVTSDDRPPQAETGAERPSTVDGGASPEDTTYIADTQLAANALDSQFFVNVTPARAPLTKHDRLGTTARSSRLVDLPLTGQAAAAPTNKSRFNNEPSGLAEGPERPRVPIESESSQERLDGSAFGQDISSLLPSSYSLTESDRARPPVGSLKRAASETLSIAAAGAADSDGTSVAHLRRSRTSPAKLATSVALSIVPPVPSQPFANLPMTIRPPAPPTSSSAFTTHVTPALQRLAADLAVSRCFAPVYVARDIEPSERGHWKVECGGWSQRLQMDFWTTLQTVIGGGSAGWGVWCYRGEDVIATEPAESSPGGDDPSAACDLALGAVKVYCFGEVVRHLYLLLYVASNSQVRRAGLQWIGGDGTVVIQMP